MTDPTTAPDTEATRYQRNPRTAGRLLDGLVFVVTPDDNTLHTLNGTGATIWQLAERPATIDELAAALASRYEVEPERARADAAAFVAELVRRGIFLAEPSPAEPSPASSDPSEDR